LEVKNIFKTSKTTLVIELKEVCACDYRQWNTMLTVNFIITFPSQALVEHMILNLYWYIE